MIIAKIGSIFKCGAASDERRQAVVTLEGERGSPCQAWARTMTVLSGS